MGYYTYYEVSWDKHEAEEIDQAIESAFDKLTGLGSIAQEYNVDEFDGHACITAYAKWYDWMDDMNKFSKMYPDILFTVSGDGENGDDLWKCVWKDGCYELQVAAIPPFTGEMVCYNSEDI